ncbi:hypothetical protein UA08_06952 [Talaromyces atroroseus]|uniref:NAD(P)-binding protein n=1 Tax=Talaromyces atroroseus TaxID=1441469 RepID=A0A225AK66_TALAT|nr:hypothetical protein UA08_06952 [Talaromyces atroroseus]OKL57598.1 hypothetical protein UA08_06952 [Talaromyces atroroseus]
MTFSEADIPRLSGKVVIVTGGSSGIGKQTVAVLASQGAKVYLGARSADKYQSALDDIHATHPKTLSANIKFLKVDLSKAEGARCAAAEFSRQENSLHILFNNAGVMGTPKGKLSDDGYEFQWAVNMFGPFVFTEQLLPLLLQTARTSPKGSVRIINTASNGAKRAPKTGIPLGNPTAWLSCTPFECYGISKIGVILWTRHLAKMHPSILSFAPHPGPVQSNLTRELKIPKLVMWILNRVVFKPVQHGALTQLYAGTCPTLSENENGSYLEPVAKIQPNLPHPQCSDDTFAERIWQWNTEAMRKALGELPEA